LFISPLLFDPPKTTFFRLCTIFIPPPETPVCYSQNTSLLFTKHPPEEEKSTTKGEASTTHTSKESYAQIRRKQHIEREETTHKTQKNVGDNSKNLQRFSEKVQRFSENLPRFLRKVQRILGKL